MTRLDGGKLPIWWQICDRHKIFCARDASEGSAAERVRQASRIIISMLEHQGYIYKPATQPTANLYDGQRTYSFLSAYHYNLAME